METISFIVTVVVGIVVAVLAFFSNRLIEQNDKFQEKTDARLTAIEQTGNANFQSIQSLRSEHPGKETLNEIKEMLKVGVPITKIDQMSKNYLITIINRVKEMETLLSLEMERRQVDHGTVIWIKDELEASQLKMKGLFEILKIIESRTSKRQGP